MKAWWLSWYTPRPLSEFELHSPWWVAGYDADDRTIIVAAVLAPTEHEAWIQVRSAFDQPVAPSDIEIRFGDEEPRLLVDRSPFTDRWPKAAWMAWEPAAGVTCACPAHGGGR